VTELTKLQKDIIKQSEYELKEWLVDAYFVAERRHQIAKVFPEKEIDIEWYQIKMNWLKRFIKIMEGEG
jgi:hypothetical protein